MNFLNHFFKIPDRKCSTKCILFCLQVTPPGSVTSESECDDSETEGDSSFDGGNSLKYNHNNKVLICCDYCGLSCQNNISLNRCRYQ